MKDSKKLEYQECEVRLEEFIPELNLWDDEKIAFIKNGMCDGKQVWLVFSADGKQIAATENRDFAFIIAKHNDYMPQSVH